MSMFQKARQAERRGQYVRASRILRRTIRRYPAHQPSRLLLGKINYRNGRIRAAYRQFKRVPADAVTPDLAYAYGVTMFTRKECDRATKAFRRVPRRSRESGLAQFYTGVCLTRKRQWQGAYSKLQQASNLPPNLASSRRKLLRTVRKRMQAERSGFLTGRNPYVIVPQPPPRPPGYAARPRGYPGAPPPKEEKKPEPPPPPQAGTSTAVTPSFTYTQKSKTVDYHGFSVKDSDARTTDLNLNVTGRYDADPLPSGGQPYLSLSVDANQWNRETSGNKVSFVAYKDDPQNVIEKTEQVEDNASRIGKLSVNPEAGAPFNSSIDISGGFEYEQSYPDMTPEEMTSKRKPYGEAAIGVGSSTATLSVSQTESLNTDGEVTLNTLSAGGSLESTWKNVTASASADYKDKVNPSETEQPNPAQVLSFAGSLTKSWDSFSITLDGSNELRTPARGKKLIPEKALNVMKAQGTGSYSFEFGGTLSVTGTMKQLQDYSKGVEAPEGYEPEQESGLNLQDEGEGATKVVAKAQGTSQKVKANFKLAPLDWIYGNVSFEYEAVTYTLEEKALELPFQRNTPDVTSTLSFQLGLTKTF